MNGMECVFIRIIYDDFLSCHHPNLSWMACLYIYDSTSLQATFFSLWDQFIRLWAVTVYVALLCSYPNLLIWWYGDMRAIFVYFTSCFLIIFWKVKKAVCFCCQIDILIVKGGNVVDEPGVFPYFVKFFRFLVISEQIIRSADPQIAGYIFMQRADSFARFCIGSDIYNFRFIDFIFFML